MGTYAGKISGIGDKDTRENEITADDLATLRHNIVGYEYGVIKDDDHDFDCNEDKESNSIVHLTDGMAFAYGYFGYCPAVDITFLLPAVEQYQLIFMEIDKSVIPNTCTIKTKNNMSTPYINANTFRQDQLSTVKTGIFQIPLWQVHLSNQGIETLVDLRDLKESIKTVESSDNADNVNDNGVLADNVTCVTETISDKSKHVASTQFVDTAIKAVINELKYYTVYYNGTLGAGSDSAINFILESDTNVLQNTEVRFIVKIVDAKYRVSRVLVTESLTDEECEVTNIGTDEYAFLMPADDVGITVYLEAV